MKKLLAIILSLATAVLASVGLSACGRQPEEEQIELINFSLTEHYAVYDLENEERRRYIEIAEKNDAFYETYDEFLNYYDNGFKQICTEKFYVFNPDYKDENIVHGYYLPYIENNDSGNKKVDRLCMSFAIIDKTLGVATAEYTEEKYSIEVNIITTQASIETESEDFNLRFGKYMLSSMDSSFNEISERYYANIYLGNTCIATLLFVPYVPISRGWFEEYINSNMNVR